MSTSRALATLAKADLESLAILLQLAQFRVAVFQRFARLVLNRLIRAAFCGVLKGFTVLLHHAQL